MINMVMRRKVGTPREVRTASMVKCKLTGGHDWSCSYRSQEQTDTLFRYCQKCYHMQTKKLLLYDYSAKWGDCYE